MPLTEALHIIAQELEKKTGVATSKSNMEILKQKTYQFMLAHSKYHIVEDLLADICGSDLLHVRIRSQLIEYLLNHETSFFRDRWPFDAIKSLILPQLVSKRKTNHKIRIWSAACSTGQEAYSLALLLSKEAEIFKDFDIEIYASDISAFALEKAQKAIYNKLEVQRGLPISDLIYYFEQININAWKLKDKIISKVTFFQHNLFEPLPHFIDSQFDIILCRNVLIYFNIDNREKVLRSLRHCLKQDGYLILGASEGMLHNQQVFSSVKNDEYMVYQLTQTN